MGNYISSFFDQGAPKAITDRSATATASTKKGAPGKAKYLKETASFVLLEDAKVIGRRSSWPSDVGGYV